MTTISFHTLTCTTMIVGKQPLLFFRGEKVEEVIFCQTNQDK